MNITQHAYKRAKERLSWKGSVLDKMSRRALHHGKQHSDTVGRLNKYITKLFFDHKKANNIRIYGENAFLFHGSTLLTLYRIPTHLIKLLKGGENSEGN